MVLGRLSVYQSSFACFVGLCTEGAVVKTESDLKDMSGVWEDRTALKCSCSETRFVVFGLSHRTHMDLSHGTRNVTSSVVDFYLTKYCVHSTIVRIAYPFHLIILVMG